MSKGGGGSQKSTSTVTQTNLPAYAKPYYERMMRRTESLSNSPYSAYPGQRVAGFGQDINDYGQGVRSLSPDLSGAMGLTQQATDMGMNGSFNPTQFNVSQWDSGQAQQYMNPYMENVYDVTRNRADQQFARDQIDRNTQWNRANPFGGSGRVVDNAVAKGQYDMNMQEMEAKAQADAYNQAYSMFGADRDALFGADTASEQSRQFGAQFGQDAAKLGLAGGAQMADLEQGQFAMDQSQLNMLKELGLLQQAQDQTGLDIGYQDFVNQRDYEKQQLNFMNGMLRGVPVSANSSVTGYSPTPNAFSQIAGLGMGVAGLNQANKAANPTA